MKILFSVLCLLFLFSRQGLAASLGGYYMYGERDALDGGLSVKNEDGNSFSLSINVVNPSTLSVCEFEGTCIRYDRNTYICKNSDNETAEGHLRLQTGADGIDVINEYKFEDITFCGHRAGVDGRYERFHPENTEAEYAKFLRASDSMQAADRKLNATWKEVTRTLSSEAKKILLEEQRSWLRTGRHARVRYFLSQGDDPYAAYTNAILERIEDIRVAGDKRIQNR